MSDAKEHWHLSKSVPLSIIGAFIMQTAVIVWNASTMRSDININARDIARMEIELSVMRTAAQTQAVQLGRIEENMIGLRQSIERLLQRIEDQERN